MSISKNSPQVTPLDGKLSTKFTWLSSFFRLKLIRRKIIFQFYLIYHYAGVISNKNIVDTY